MKRFILVVLTCSLFFLPLNGICESIDLSDFFQEGFLSLFASEQKQNVQELTEPEMIEKAIEAIKNLWQKDYSEIGNGYLEILHTRIVYIKSEAAQSDDKYTSQYFGNVYCIVEFTLYSDYFGSAPYYQDLGINDSVVFYLDGTTEAVKNSRFNLYRSRTYISDYSNIIESIKDFGTAYNAVFNVLN